MSKLENSDGSGEARRLGPAAAVFLISAASLALEVLQMRIFAYVLWHHLAFLVISVAILGFSAAGAVLASSRRLLQKDVGSSIAGAGVLFALSTLVGPWLLIRYPIDIFAQLGVREVLRTGVYLLAFSLPYFFAGYVISLVLTRRAREAGRLYFVNLLGSGVGCFLVFATLLALGAERNLFLLGSLGGVAAVIGGARGGLRVLGGVVALAFLALVPFADRIATFTAAESKSITQGLRFPESRISHTRWTPVCRIDVCESPLVKTKYIYQDGDAPAILPGEPEKVVGCPALAYTLVDAPKTLVIGVGGGVDVKTAMDYGSREVDGAELNRITAGLAQDPQYSGVAERIAADPNVRIHNAEGRYFVRSSGQKFDLIQMTGVDTYTALSSGAYVLSESYLYTIEAFEDYLDHLTDDGLVAIVRFAFPAPRETLRTMVIACEALKRRGVAEPWRHLAVMRASPHAGGDTTFTKSTSHAAILVKKQPFTAEELATLRAYGDQYQMVRDYLPDEDGVFTEADIDRLESYIESDAAFQHYVVGENEKNPFHAFVDALRAGQEEEFFRSYPYDVRPVDDDEPFFFNQHKIGSLWDWLLRQESKIAFAEDVPWAAMSLLFQVRPLGLITLFLTVVQLSVLVALCVFLPLFFFRREGIRESGFLTPMGYFSCLGFGYMFLMISSMQRFGLILGHPAYAIPITMATFMLASGFGSFFSDRFLPTRGGRVLGVVVVVLLVESALLHLFLPGLTQRLLAESFAARAGVVVALIAPMAFVMGMCFPIGIRLVRAGSEALVPWGFGVNGAATVLGSVVAVCLALAVGFTNVQWIAFALYVLAAWLMTRLVKSYGAAAAN